MAFYSHFALAALLCSAVLISGGIANGGPDSSTTSDTALPDVASCGVDGSGEEECEGPTALIQSSSSLHSRKRVQNYGEKIVSAASWFNSDLHPSRADQTYAAPNCTAASSRNQTSHGESLPWLAQGNTVAAVNEWHFDMVNDRGRNNFYFSSIGRHVPGKRVLVLGSGSAILDLMSWEQGAESVLGLEADPDLFEVACKNVQLNKADKKVNIIRGMSRDVTLAEQDRGDVLVSELFGNFLLGESLLAYIPDARDRLLKPGGQVIPPVASQHAVLVRSEALWRHHFVSGYRDIKLQALNSLAYATDEQDFDYLPTSFEEQPYRLVAPRASLYSVDFNKVQEDDIFTGEVQMVAQESGPVHALVFTWEALGDSTGHLRLDTHLSGHQDAMPNENRWHRATEWQRPFVWLAEQANPSDPTTKRELILQKGESLRVRFFSDWRSLNVTVERARTSL